MYAVPVCVSQLQAEVCSAELCLAEGVQTAVCSAVAFQAAGSVSPNGNYPAADEVAAADCLGGVACFGGVACLGGVACCGRAAGCFLL